ncbi:MAG: thioredoxin [Bacteroidia bacterium]|nr:MAG: thioredoxin [Bacteroidia bacterium]
MPVIELNDQNFEEIVLKSELPVLVDLWAAWCGPCKMLLPIMNELAEEYEGKVKITKLDVDQNKEISAKYGVRNIPTILFFKNGELVDKQVGALPKKKFVAKIDELL